MLKRKVDIVQPLQQALALEFKRLVEQGLGVALVPRLTAQSEIARKQVVALTVREMRLERSIYLIYRKGATLSHAARAFLRVAREKRSDS